MTHSPEADVLVVGAGLAGLVTATEIAATGKSVLILDQENAANIGGQAFWSFGGLFLVDSPEQRRVGIHDSFDLAWTDWQATAGFDRPDEDAWPRRWAEAYVHFAAEEKRSGSPSWEFRSFRSWAGPSGAAQQHWGRGTRCPVFTSPGAPVPHWSMRLPVVSRRQADESASPTGIASTRSPHATER